MDVCYLIIWSKMFKSSVQSSNSEIIDLWFEAWKLVFVKRDMGVYKNDL